MKTITNCLSLGDLVVDWDHWISIVDQATKTDEKIRFASKTMEIDSAIVNKFLTERFVEEQEESLVKDLWNAASPDERKIIGKLLFKVIDNSAHNVRKKAEEPYGGY